MLLFIFEYSYKINHQINGTYYKQEEPNWWTSHYASHYIFKLLKTKKRNRIRCFRMDNIIFISWFSFKTFFIYFLGRKNAVFFFWGTNKEWSKSRLWLRNIGRGTWFFLKDYALAHLRINLGLERSSGRCIGLTFQMIGFWLDYCF